MPEGNAVAVVRRLKASQRTGGRRRIVVDSPRIAGKIGEAAGRPREDLLGVRDAVAPLAQALKLRPVAGQHRERALGALLAQLLVELVTGGGIGVPRNE
jgi:hypothetical protein